MSHLKAKKLPNGKLIIFNKKKGATQGKPMDNTPANKAKIKAEDTKQDKAMGETE